MKTSWHDSLSLGGKVMPNRVCIPAHSYNFTEDKDGLNDYVGYVSARINNGVGMMVIGEAEVPIDLRNGFSRSREAGSSFSLDLYSELNCLRTESAGILIEQLYSPGGQVWFEEERMSYAPSSVIQPITGTLPAELTEKEVSKIPSFFGLAASIICKNGIDGIELKADQGKLHHQFLSPSFNERVDLYGGSLINRTRIIVESLNEIRNKVGENFIVGIRLPINLHEPVGLNCNNFFPDLSVSELGEVIGILLDLELVDYVSLSMGTNSTAHGYWRGHPDWYNECAIEKSYVKGIRAQHNVPILFSGNIIDLNEANILLCEEVCDIVGMARAFIADHELISKHQKKIPQRKCIGCNISCVGRTWYGNSVRCVYNPSAGRENQFTNDDKRRYKIAVIGAGPAGCEFARVSSEYGSEITVFEKNKNLGGLVNAWANLPDRNRFFEILNYYEEILKNKSNINVIFNHKVNITDELTNQFDYIVIASGGTMDIYYGDCQFDNLRSWSPEKAVFDATWQKNNVVIYQASPSRDGFGLAELARKNGAEVTMVTPLDHLGLGFDPVRHAKGIGVLKKMKIPFEEYIHLSVNNGKLYWFDHALNLVRHAKEFTDVIWCINPLPYRLEVGKNVVLVGESAGYHGLEASVRSGYDAAKVMHGAKRR